MLNERVIRHLFAKSTTDEDGYIRKVYSYNIVVSCACAATHKNREHRGLNEFCCGYQRSSGMCLSRCDFNLKTEPPHRHIRVDPLCLAEYPVKQEHALSLETEAILIHKYACQSVCALFGKYPHLQLCPNNTVTTLLLSLYKEFFNQSLVSWICI